MTLAIVLIIVLIVFAVYAHRKLHKANNSSLDAYVSELSKSKSLDTDLNAALLKAQEIADKNGIDLNK